MTKKELIRVFDNLAIKVDNIVGNLKEALDELREVHIELENLPHEEDEIDNSEVEETT